MIKGSLLMRRTEVGVGMHAVYRDQGDHVKIGQSKLFDKRKRGLRVTTLSGACHVLSKLGENLKHEEKNEELDLARLVQLPKRLDSRVQPRYFLHFFVRAVNVTQAHDDPGHHNDTRPDQNARQVRLYVSA
jgi:hypothetical protein